MITNAMYSGFATIQAGMKLMDGSAQAIARQAIASPDAMANPPNGNPPSGTPPLISPTGDVTEALLQQRLALYQVQAGAKIIQTSDKALGSLLDEVA